MNLKTVCSSLKLNKIHSSRSSDSPYSSQHITVILSAHRLDWKCMMLYLMAAMLWFDPTGSGCSRGDLVVSQLFANSRASHCGCG